MIPRVTDKTHIYIEALTSIRYIDIGDRIYVTCILVHSLAAFVAEVDIRHSSYWFAALKLLLRYNRFNLNQIPDAVNGRTVTI